MQKYNFQVLGEGGGVGEGETAEKKKLLKEILNKK